MTIKDIQPIRLPFSDMPAALARGDVDAYVGAEPAPGISLANGTGRWSSIPIPRRSARSTWSCRRASRHDRRRIPSASRWSSTCTARRSTTRWRTSTQIVEMAVQKLGQQRSRSSSRCRTSSSPGRSTTCSCKRAKAYAQLMHEKKQIRAAARSQASSSREVQFHVTSRSSRGLEHVEPSRSTALPDGDRSRAAPEAPAGGAPAAARALLPERLQRDRCSAPASRSLLVLLLALRRRLHRHAADPEPVRSRA